jgi:polysaccharide export outer membrane protein
MTSLRFLIAALVATLVMTATSVVAQQSYRVKPGDVLRIEVVEDPTLNRTVLVAPDGRITVPGAGAITAGGQSVDQITAALTTQLAPGFANTPNVFVGLEALAPIPPRVPAAPVEKLPDPVVNIFVIGEAGKAGKLAVTPGTTLLQAFAEFGGFTNFAATRRIQLRRGETVYAIDYDAILSGQSPNGQVAVAEGDVIVIPQRRLFE